jgi:general secretion pathway protein D
LTGNTEERKRESLPQPENISTHSRTRRGVRHDNTADADREAFARAVSCVPVLGGRSLFRLASVALSVWLLAAPALALAPKGQKNYKQGLEYEASQQWEKAAEEFSLALAAEPSNSEYQLHYRRALFNASQFFAQQGGALMERGDYLGAYNAFRRAYGYDSSNELARSLMERAYQLQLGKGDENKTDKAGAPKPQAQASAMLAPTVYRPGDDADASTRRGASKQDEQPASPRSEQLHAVQYNGDLEKFIKYLARELRLNVVFDRDFPKRSVDVDLQDVSAAQALDYIFVTQGLFFQKLSNRTILVAEQVKRPQYQQLVLRTFYLYNVDPNDARQLITASIPPQAGRQPVITANKSTNSITVRDTPENVRLIGELLKSIDKERAEVVMDVNIYEVSRDDLIQLGNQIGTGDSLLNLGGIQKGLSVIGGSRQVVTQALSSLPTALGAAFMVPPTALSALQSRSNTRLVASTQVHAFDGEKSTAHIGQRVPVQTASVAPYGAVATGDGSNPQQGVTQGLFGGNGYPVIQYEKTGLTLEFTPQVFPDLDVQVKMNIKSDAVEQTVGAPALTPTFTERNIEGTARIQNNRTMMIASVAQNQQTRGRQGLPVLGLVPILGRAFSAPRRDDTQTDIVIAVTPHVMRAPSVTPSDEEMRPSGTLQTPTSDTLEAMIQQVDREEQLAVARAVPTNINVELPDLKPETASAQAATRDAQPTPSANESRAAVRPPAASASPAVAEPAAFKTSAAGAKTSAAEGEPAVVEEAETFIPAPKPLMTSAAEQPAERPAAREAVLSVADQKSRPADDKPMPAGETNRPASNNTNRPASNQSSKASGNSLFSFGQTAPTGGAGRTTTGNPGATGDEEQSNARTERATLGGNATDAASAPAALVTEKSPDSMRDAGATSAAALRLMTDAQPMRVGERRRLKLLLKTDAPLGLIALALRLDTRVLAVRSVGVGTLFAPGDAHVTHAVTPEGLLVITVTPDASAAPLSGAGVLLNVEVEALAGGDAPLRFEADDVHVVATDGRKVLLRVMTDQLSVGR